MSSLKSLKGHEYAAASHLKSVIAKPGNAEVIMRIDRLVASSNNADRKKHLEKIINEFILSTDKGEVS